MGHKQLIQLLQYILAWVLVWCFVVFVMEEPFVDFVLEYWLYFLIVSISYFYYYSIEYEPDKKFRLIRNVIIYGNVYLFAHIFFRPILNISHQLFVLLWLIVLWIWWSTKLQSRWRYLLQIVGWIFSFFILISGVFYLYPEAPDIKWFVETKWYHILVSGIDESVKKRDAYIQIMSERRTDDYEIVPYLDKILEENCKITYPSMTTNRNEKVIIMTAYGDIFWIFPQSEIQLEFDEKELSKVSKLDWRVWFLSWVFESSMEYIWDVEDLTQEQQEWMETQQYAYKYDLVSHLKKQISRGNMSLATNTIMRDVDGKLIGYLARMFPTTFGKNLRNYNEFQKYFGLVSEDKVVLGRYSSKQQSWWSMKSLWNNLRKNMGIGMENTIDVFKSY